MFIIKAATTDSSTTGASVTIPAALAGYDASAARISIASAVLVTVESLR